MKIFDIQKAVCEEFGISMATLLSNSKRKSCTLPRHIAMGMSRYITKKSYPEIAKAFKRKDHTTIIHAVRHMNEITKQKIWQDRVDAVMEKLR